MPIQHLNLPNQPCIIALTDILTPVDLEELANTTVDSVNISHTINATQFVEICEILTKNRRIKTINLNIQPKIINYLENGLSLLKRKNNSFKLFINQEAIPSQAKNIHKMLSNHLGSLPHVIFQQQIGEFIVERKNTSSSSDYVLNYYYYHFGQPKELIALTIQNDLLATLTIKNEDNRIVPSGVPHANLLNYLLQNANKPEEADNIRKLALNYMQGPMSDYLDYRLQHGLIISNFDLDDKEYLKDVLFNDALFPILEKEGIYYCLANKTLWLRDFGVCKGNGEQLLHPQNLLAYPNHQLSLKIATEHPESHLSLDLPGVFNSHIGGSTSVGGGQAERESLIFHCVKNGVPYELSRTLLEGGNIVTVEKDNKIYVIIGKNLLISNAVYQNQLGFDESNKQEMQILKSDFLTKKHHHNNKFYTWLTKKNVGIDAACIKQTRRVMAKQLNVPYEQLIFIPNAEYHIDCLLALGPKGIIFLNDFRLVRDIALADHQDTKSLFSKNIADVADLFLSKVDKLYNAIHLKLIRKGFKVVRVPAVGIVQIDPADSENRADTHRYVINFLNGYTGYGKNGFFHIALTSGIAAFDNAFTEILKANGVDNVYLIGSNNIGMRILKFEGSLRCLSIPGSNILGNLGNRTTFSEYMDLKSKSPVDSPVSSDDESDDDATPSLDLLSDDGADELANDEIMEDLNETKGENTRSAPIFQNGNHAAFFNSTRSITTVAQSQDKNSPFCIRK